MKNLFYETFKQWRNEDVTRMGAALAYYAALALLPMMLLSTAALGALYGPEAAENQILQQVRQIIGPQASVVVQDAIHNVGSELGLNSLTAVVSTLLLLFSATGVFRHLKDSLNIIWGVKPKPQSKMRGFIQNSLISLAFVMGLGLGILILLLLNAALFTFVRSMNHLMPDLKSVQLWQAIGMLGLYSTTMLVFALVYKVLPDAHIAWGDVWSGAAVTAFLFTVGQLMIGFFFGFLSRLDTIYGAASALMIALIWVHLSAHILLFGAEFTQVYANMYGSKISSNSIESEAIPLTIGTD
jgi:membrane protein